MTNRRGFVGLAFAALGAVLPVAAAAPASAAPAKPAAAKPPVQRARLPRRLATDFRSHIETRLPHLRVPFEIAAKDTGLDWRLLAER